MEQFDEISSLNPNGQKSIVEQTIKSQCNSKGFLIAYYTLNAMSLTLSVIIFLITVINSAHNAVYCPVINNVNLLLCTYSSMNTFFIAFNVWMLLFNIFVFAITNIWNTFNGYQLAKNIKNHTNAKLTILIYPFLIILGFDLICLISMSVALAKGIYDQANMIGLAYETFITSSMFYNIFIAIFAISIVKLVIDIANLVFTLISFQKSSEMYNKGYTIKPSNSSGNGYMGELCVGCCFLGCCDFSMCRCNPVACIVCIPCCFVACIGALCSVIQCCLTRAMIADMDGENIRIQICGADISGICGQIFAWSICFMSSFSMIITACWFVWRLVLIIISSAFISNTPAITNILSCTMAFNITYVIFITLLNFSLQCNSLQHYIKHGYVNNIIIKLIFLLIGIWYLFLTIFYFQLFYGVVYGNTAGNSVFAVMSMPGFGGVDNTVSIAADITSGVISCIEAVFYLISFINWLYIMSVALFTNVTN